MSSIIETPVELSGLNDSACRFFYELVTREFVVNSRLRVSSSQLAKAIPCASSTRSVQRWLKAIIDEDLMGARKIWLTPDHYVRELFLSDKGKKAQKSILVGLN